jgi:YidC/Oxa1 family membrane protein insertase
VIILALGVWQALLDGIGWVLARIYDVIPNYGLSIIVLTILIRLILLPLGIKQIKSMQHMQAIQPKIKELQKKYKNNKQKQQEETMKLYREAGVNPLGGCLPLLLQFPILISMYSVIRAPQLQPLPSNPEVYQVANNHLPEDSALFRNVILHENTDFLWMNLQCSLVQAGTQPPLTDTQRTDVVAGRPIVGEDGQPLGLDAKSVATLDCGDNKVVDKIPYIVLLLLMIATTFYQQRQMQQASPPGSQSQQQQAILKFLPLMFAFFGLSFPAGLVLYWTTSNAFQIGQQTFLLRAGHIGPEALERRMAEQRQKSANPTKPGFMARMMQKAESATEEREQLRGPRKPTPGSGGTGAPGRTGGSGRRSGGSGKPGSGNAGGSGKAGGSRTTPKGRPKPTGGGEAGGSGPSEGEPDEPKGR